MPLSAVRLAGVFLLQKKVSVYFDIKINITIFVV